MFSGIVKCVGTLETITEKGSTIVLTVSSPISDSLQIDQSVAHDGVCLTVVNAGKGTHQVEVVKETLSKSRLGFYTPGQMINLERSISPVTLLDGHLVQGHVDTTVKCTQIDNLDGSWKFHFNLPQQFASLMIPQGSICLNGVSLTISDLTRDSFAVSIIPYTFENTNFKELKTGDPVNVEFDLIGKYIVRQMELRSLSE